MITNFQSIQDFSIQKIRLDSSHITFVIPSLSGGGAQRNVIRLATALEQRGHSIDILLRERKIQFPDDIAQGVRIFVLGQDFDRRWTDRSSTTLEQSTRHRLADDYLTWFRLARLFNSQIRLIPSLQTIRYAQDIAAFLSHHKPDYVLPQLPYAETATLLACHIMNEHPPVIPIIRGDMRYRLHKSRSRFRLLSSKASHIIAVSMGVAESISEMCDIPASNITSIYNPTPVDEIQELSMQEPAHPWFNSGNTPIILAVGRLSPQKDFSTLIRAFSNVRNKRACRLIILGEGECREFLENLISELHLADAVSLPGFFKNPFSLMRRATVFVLSSRWEGLGTVLIEALACGCPCISTDCRSGPAEILKNGQFGELVAVGDEFALANAMLKALSREADKRYLRLRANSFGVKQATDCYEAVFDRVRNVSATGK